MKVSEFLELSARTAGVDTFINTGSKDDLQLAVLLHASLGMNTEQAEFADVLKKRLMYGKSIDLVNLKEELGDQLWYVALAIRALGSSFEEIFAMNVAKLEKRFPERYSQAKALVRDLEGERKVLEGK